MAPPRQRPAAAANLDDSRSEASSTRERQAGAKGRKAAAASKESNKPTSFPASADPAHRTANADHNNANTSNPSISWPTMPLSVLHEYRHVYNLPCPSAYSSQINSINLSQGIGLLSPTAIAARRAHHASSSSPTATTTTTTATLAGRKSKPDTDAQSTTSSTKRGGAESKDNPPSSRATSANPPPVATTANSIETRKPVKKGGGGSGSGGGCSGLDLHRVSSIIPAQGRVSKDHLASSVRKHFNNTAISEQDAIARFLYKVNEERKGREFRLRFQP